MDKINDGGPAFPRPIGNNGAADFHDREVSGESEGMSLRDYFAGQALSSLLSNINYADGVFEKSVAKNAYAFADAMLAERGQP